MSWCVKESWLTEPEPEPEPVSPQSACWSLPGPAGSPGPWWRWRGTRGGRTPPPAPSRPAAGSSAARRACPRPASPRWTPRPASEPAGSDRTGQLVKPSALPSGQKSVTDETEGAGHLFESSRKVVGPVQTDRTEPEQNQNIKSTNFFFFLNDPSLKLISAQAEWSFLNLFPDLNPGHMTLVSLVDSQNFGLYDPNGSLRHTGEPSGLSVMFWASLQSTSTSDDDVSETQQNQRLQQVQ